MTPPLPVIDLSLASGHVGVIVMWPSGVRYTTQTGGTACFHPEAEGVFALLTDDYKRILEHLTEHFEGVRDVAGWTGISEATASFIEQVVHGYPEHRGIHVDRERLEESHEAWVYVTVSPIDDDLSPFVNFGVVNGVLTWENSD